MLAEIEYILTTQLDKLKALFLGARVIFLNSTRYAELAVIELYELLKNTLYTLLSEILFRYSASPLIPLVVYRIEKSPISTLDGVALFTCMALPVKPAAIVRIVCNIPDPCKDIEPGMLII